MDKLYRNVALESWTSRKLLLKQASSRPPIPTNTASSTRKFVRQGDFTHNHFQLTEVSHELVRTRAKGRPHLPPAPTPPYVEVAEGNTLHIHT